MGLDIYAYKTTETAPHEGYHNDTADDGIELLHYWREHPNLHGWMEDLFLDRGGTETFNCVSLFLEADDLDRLEADILAGTLPHTEGFFFGSSDGSEQGDDLAFVAQARAALAEGCAVFYRAWW